MTTVTLTPASTSPWLCPAGVYTLTSVKCKGPGGKGGPSSFGGSPACGGGGGESAEEDNVAVTPGNSYNFRCPSGGSGLDTFFAADSATITAHHGQDGTRTSPGAAGTGSVNTRHFDGGPGGLGSTSGTAGGGGGSGAGDSAAGAAGGTGSGSTSGAGGVAPSGGGNGGAGGSVSGSAGTAGASPGGGGGGAGSSNTGTAGGGDGQIILTYTVQSNTTVTGVPGTITVAGFGGTAGTGSNGVAGTVSVTAPAGAVSVSGTWVTFGVTGQITASAPAGTVNIVIPGPAGTVTVAGQPASLLVHVTVPVPVTPPSAFRGFSRIAFHGRLRYRRRALPPLQPAVRSSSVAAVPAPPMTTWNVRSTVTAAARISWAARQLLMVPPSGPAEIEVLPIEGLPGPGTVPQIAWNIRAQASAQTRLTTFYGIKRHISPAVLRRARRLPFITVWRQQSAARQATGPPIAWRVYGGVTAAARSSWNLRVRVTSAAYVSWNTGPGTHGVITALAVMSWNTDDQIVTVTAAVTWNSLAQVSRQAVIRWMAYQRLAVVKLAVWNTLMAAARTRYTARKHPALSRVLRRGIRLRGQEAQSAAPVSTGALCLIRWQTRGLVIIQGGSSGGRMAAVPGLLVPGLAIPGNPGTAQGGAAISWDIRAVISAASYATWNVSHRASAMSPQAAWNTRKPVTALAASGWNTRVKVVHDPELSTWAVLDPGPAVAAGVTWNIRSQLAKNAIVRWNTRGLTSLTASTGWDINPAVSAVSPAISWRVLYRTGAAVASVSWASRENITATAAVKWDVIATMDPDVIITWNLRNQVAAARLLQWNIGQPVQGSMRAAAMDEWFTPE